MDQYWQFRDSLQALHRKDNIYWALLKFLVLAMALFSICRLGFYVFNLDLFPGMTAKRFAIIFFGGLRFDLTAVLYFNSLVILLLILPFHFRFHPVLQKAIRIIFVVTNGIALATNVADFIYYRFTLRRTSLNVLDQFRNETNWGSLLFHFLIDFWYAVLFWLVLMFLLILISGRIKFEGPQIKGIAFYTWGSLAMAVAISLFIAGARGGFGSKPPISMINAAEYATVPRDINLVLNTPFTLLKTDPAGIVARKHYFQSEDSLRLAFDPVRVPKDTGVFHPDNVVIIILESFSSEFVGAYNKDAPYTPFLDSLIGSSRAYAYSMANGLRSIEAMPAVICSIPSLETPYLLSHYAGNKVNSLPSLLKEKGYFSAFFHGAANGSMGFQAFANLCGFDDYYGRDEYGQEDYDGIWGIWDEKFLQFYANKINTFQPPFFTAIHTVSSHHPFNIPKEYRDKFHGGQLPIHKTIGYVDYSLRRFFETAKGMPWFSNTLFVVTADHTASWGSFSIPIFFYKPGAGWSSFKPEIIQQIDIMPTILGYLNYDRPYVAFGRNIFDEKSEPVAFHYLDNNFEIFMGDFVLDFNGTETRGLYNFKTDPGKKTGVGTGTQTKLHMGEKLMGVIQQYNNRMIDDDLTMEGPQVKVKH